MMTEGHIGALSLTLTPDLAPRADSLPGINNTAGSTGMRSRNQSPKMRGLFTANTVRGMRYPLRRTTTAPRNIVTNDLPQGHFTCTPSITIGADRVNNSRERKNPAR
jgi:hypothetical protein